MVDKLLSVITVKRMPQPAPHDLNCDGVEVLLSLAGRVSSPMMCSREKRPLNITSIFGVSLTMPQRALRRITPFGVILYGSIQMADHVTAERQRRCACLCGQHIHPRNRIKIVAYEQRYLWACYEMEA